MNYFETKGNHLIYRFDGETVMITPWGDNALRTRSVFMGEIRKEENALLPLSELGASESVPEIILASDTLAVIRNGKLRAELNVDLWGDEARLRIVYKNAQGKELLSEIYFGGALMLRAREYKTAGGDGYRLKVTFQSDPEEKIFGMGQYQQVRMNLKGCNLELAQRNKQASVPFYVSSLGYGFLWNNPAVGEVHFGLNTTEWRAECTHQMDYWITAGDSPKEIEKQYSEVTGRAPMMPEYGLGFWQSKLRYYNQTQVLEVAREFKRRNIPLDVLVIDFFHWPKCGDWRFDEEFFPDPAAMVRELHDMGIETMVSVWPQVNDQSENYREMRQKNLLVRANSGVDIQMLFQGNNAFADVTNPGTRKYMWEKFKKNYADYGIRTFWLDEAEPEFTTYDYENYRYHAGRVLEVGNRYPLDYARIFYEGERANGQEDTVSLIRCAWAGSQRYGALVWSGDIESSYEDLRRQICAGIHMGLSGIPWWTTDIGGFYNGNSESEEFRELLARWYEFGTFCPVMRTHGSRHPGHEIFDQSGRQRLSSGGDNEPWSFGEDMEKLIVKYIRIREKMRDYTRSLMKEAHECGSPVLRALYYEFPKDAAVTDIADEYMYGPELLVAPVCQPRAREREVYLPQGADWVSAHTGERFSGGQSITVPAPIDVLPLFLRNGAQDWLVGEI